MDRASGLGGESTAAFRSVGGPNACEADVGIVRSCLGCLFAFLRAVEETIDGETCFKMFVTGFEY